MSLRTFLFLRLKIDMTEYVETFQRRHERLVATIINQYTDCSRPLNDLFRLVPDSCWESDGLGCCDTDRSMAEDGLVGPAYPALIEMREARRDEEGLVLRNACPYHKKGEGCILGELKSPRCLRHFCYGELPEGFDSRYISETLQKILDGGLDWQTGTSHPERNLPLVAEFRSYVDRLVENAKAGKTYQLGKKRLNSDRACSGVP